MRQKKGNENPLLRQTSRTPGQRIQTFVETGEGQAVNHVCLMHGSCVDSEAGNGCVATLPMSAISIDRNHCLSNA